MGTSHPRLQRVNSTYPLVRVHRSEMPHISDEFAATRQTGNPCQNETHALQQFTCTDCDGLLNHLIGTSEQRWWAGLVLSLGQLGTLHPRRSSVLATGAGKEAKSRRPSLSVGSYFQDCGFSVGQRPHSLR
jgi:hypothetical protein